MLSAQEVQLLRQRVIAVQGASVSTPRLWGICVGGPLHGICVRLDPANCQGSEATFGWATVTERGCIVAQYGTPDDHGWMHFLRYHSPAVTESGIPVETCFTRKDNESLPGYYSAAQ